MRSNLSVSYDLCIISVTIQFSHSVLNVKALEGAFNQKRALVGAFSVIVKLMDRFTALLL